MPEEPEPQPERFANDPLNARGQPRKIARKVNQQEKEQRVEFVRGMIRLNFTAGDIKRIASKKWGTSKRSVEDYIAVARKRNRDSLATDEDQSLADSLAYWSQKQQQAEQTIAREQQTYQKAVETYNACEREITDIETGDPEKGAERLEILEMRKRNAVAVMDNCRRATFSAQQDSRESQDRIDKLKGNLAPIKIARTNAKGQDVGTLTERELEEAMRRLGMQPTKFIDAVEVKKIPGPTNDQSELITEARRFDAG